MPTRPAIATALAALHEAFPTRAVTPQTAAVYGDALAELSDTELLAATRALIRQPGRTFFPSPGELLEAARPPGPPVDVDRLTFLLGGLCARTPHGARPPHPADIAAHFGPAVAEAVAAVGADRLLIGSEESAIWARKELRALLANLRDLEPEVPRVGQPSRSLPALLAARQQRTADALTGPADPRVARLVAGIGGP